MRISTDQEDRELQEALRVRKMSGEQRSAWARENWDPLQRLMTQEMGPFMGKGFEAHFFETMEEKNAFDDQRELQVALAVAKKRRGEAGEKR